MGFRKIRYIPPVPTINLQAVIYRSISSVSVIAIVAVIVLSVFYHEIEPEKGELVVNGFHCKIPELTTLPLLKPKNKLRPCETKGYLTSILSTANYDDPLFVKFVPDDLISYGISNLDVKDVKCCFRIVNRVPGNDSAVKISDPCIEFHGGEQIKDFEVDRNIETIFVECSKDGKVFYENAHSIIAHKKNIKRQIEKKVESKKKYKVVMFGIDGMSRINLKRGMPSVYSLIKNSPGWIEMKGFTRISNESFSNLFALLTGKSPTEIDGRCDPRSNSYLDDCNFIWKDFADAGYVTTFAEDQAAFATFNRRHKGFKTQPTDHYFRPFVLTAEKKLKIRVDDGLVSCLGWSIYIDHIFMHATKMGQVHERDPYFGVFYVNSLRNKRMSTARAMDARVKQQFSEIAGRDTFAETIVILFGDKGLRFDEYSSGFYEERLPFLYIRLPPKFQKSHPNYVSSMRLNSHRLTTPYDLYITLRHIINLTSHKKLVLSAGGCLNNCKSLFYEVQPMRRCSDVNIPDDSCPCSLVTLSENKDILKLAAQHAVETLNRNLKKMKADNENDCVHLKLANIVSGSQQLFTPWSMNYLIQFKVSPSDAKFEVLIRRKFSTIVSLTPQFEILQEIVHMSEVNRTIFCIPRFNAAVLSKSSNKADFDKKFNRDVDDVSYGGDS